MPSPFTDERRSLRARRRTSPRRPTLPPGLGFGQHTCICVQTIYASAWKSKQTAASTHLDGFCDVRSVAAKMKVGPRIVVE